MDETFWILFKYAIAVYPVVLAVVGFFTYLVSIFYG